MITYNINNNDKLQAIINELKSNSDNTNVTISEPMKITDGTNNLVINSDGSLSFSIDKKVKYEISRSDSTTSIEYYGFVNGNNKWYIMKIENEIYTYINGSTDFLTNWTNRTSLTYVEYNTLTW